MGDISVINEIKQLKYPTTTNYSFCQEDPSEPSYRELRRTAKKLGIKSSLLWTKKDYIDAISDKNNAKSNLFFDETCEVVYNEFIEMLKQQTRSIEAVQNRLPDLTETYRKKIKAQNDEIVRLQRNLCLRKEEK